MTLNVDLTPFHGGQGEWQVGVARSVEGELVPCQNGLHAVTLGQLPLWLGPSIHPVLAVSDERVDGGNKYAKHLGWQDERCDEIVRVARQYADGLADDASLAAARETAMEAVCAAATAAWDVAWAAAGEAAREAERSWQAERLARYLRGELP